jgi:hypothetical protein
MQLLIADLRQVVCGSENKSLQIRLSREMDRAQIGRRFDSG